jgi:alkylation response protein AidB-like acyl-CoA dehydrogenase
MRLHYDDETEAFRAEFLSWVAENLPPPEERTERVLSSAHIPEWGRRWQRRLFDAGWLVPGWPSELGGRNATPVQQMVYFEEIARNDVPRGFNPQGMSIITPSIVDVGTDEQRERFAIPTLRGEITWCLGMSEPGAGSDLAGLSTRAEVYDDRFVISGQKVWTSGAQHADYCFCFVRTDPDAPKHRGISVVIVDMRQPGITIRPLPELTNPERADFNEVFFDEVEVPRAHLVGELNHGWAVAGGSLAHERGMLWVSNATAAEGALDELVAELSSRGVATDPLVRDRVASLYIDTQAMRLLGYRGFAKFAKGMDSPEHSILKLYGSELVRRLYLTATECLGADVLDVAGYDERRIDEGPWPLRYLQSFSGTIAGGTSEIQRNIIAERVLALPRR